MYVRIPSLPRGQGYAQEGNVDDSDDCQYEAWPNRLGIPVIIPSASEQPEPNSLQDQAPACLKKILQARSTCKLGACGEAHSEKSPSELSYSVIK